MFAIKNNGKQKYLFSTELLNKALNCLLPN